MSVEKMEKYKEYKKHRKEILRKQKRKERIYNTLGISSVVLILCLVGFLIYQDVKPGYEATPSFIDWSQYIPDDVIDGEDDTEDTGSEEAAEEAASDKTTE